MLTLFGWTHIVIDDHGDPIALVRDVEEINGFDHGTVWFLDHPDMPPMFTNLGRFDIFPIREIARSVRDEILWRIQGTPSPLA